MNNETTKKEMSISLGMVHDVGRNVSPSMTVYVKDPKPRFEKYYTLKRDKVNVTRIILGSHTGTHVFYCFSTANKWACQIDIDNFLPNIC